MSTEDRPGGNRIARPLQFGLRTLLAVTTLVALVATVVFRGPDPLRTPAILVVWLGILTFLTAVVYRQYGTSDQRAYCVGAALAMSGWLAHAFCRHCQLLIDFWAMEPEFRWVSWRSSSLYAGAMLLALPSAIVVGFIAVGLRHATLSADKSIARSRKAAEECENRLVKEGRLNKPRSVASNIYLEWDDAGGTDDFAE